MNNQKLGELSEQIEMKVMEPFDDAQRSRKKPQFVMSKTITEEELNQHLRKTSSFYHKLDEYENQFMQNQVDDVEGNHGREILLLLLQVILSALKAPLYLLLDGHEISGVAWRQMLIGIIYLMRALYEINDTSFVMNGLSGKSFFFACLAQTVYVVTLSISIRYINMSIALMFYNCSVLIFFVFKYVKGISHTHYESLGGSLGVLSLILIFTEEQLHSGGQLYGVVIALVGATSALIYAYYAYDLEQQFPHYMWLSLTRLVPGIMLIVASIVGQESLNLLNWRSLFVLALHILLTEMVVNHLQLRIRRVLDPFTQKAGSLLEPIPACLYGYLLHEVLAHNIYTQQELPSVYVWVCMLSFIASSILMQRGRLEKEGQEITFKRLKSFGH